MIIIVTGFEANIDENADAHGYPKRKSENIQQGYIPVSDQVPEGRKEIVLKHGADNGIKLANTSKKSICVPICL